MNKNILITLSAILLIVCGITTTLLVKNTNSNPYNKLSQTVMEINEDMNGALNQFATTLKPNDTAPLHKKEGQNIFIDISSLSEASSHMIELKIKNAAFAIISPILQDWHTNRFLSFSKLGGNTSYSFTPVSDEISIFLVSAKNTINIADLYDNNTSANILVVPYLSNENFSNLVLHISAGLNNSEEIPMIEYVSHS